MIAAIKDTQLDNKSAKVSTKPKRKFNKNISLINKLFVYGILMAILLASLYISYTYVNESMLKMNQDKDTLQKYSQKLNNDIIELENKARIAKKYIGIWNSIPENKKQLDGIQLSDVKKLLDNLTKKYDFRNVQINAETPETLGGVFSKEKIRASTSLVTITFDSLLDSSVYDFIEKVVSNLNGFTLIESVSISKQQQINDQYLLSLSNNKDTKLPIKSIINIRLYGLNKK
jgi:hypothetical protein